MKGKNPICVKQILCYTSFHDKRLSPPPRKREQNPSLVKAVREGNQNRKERKEPDYIELVSMTIKPGEEIIVGQRLRALLGEAQKKAAT